MSDSKPDTTPASVVLQSSPKQLSVEESEIQIPPAAQLETELNENIGIVDEDVNNISIADTEPCETEVVEAPSENDTEEDVDQDVSDQIEDAKEEDLNVQISKVEEPDNTETKRTGEQDKESTSEVTEILEKNTDNEVDIANTNEPQLLPTAQDENEGGDVVQNAEQLNTNESELLTTVLDEDKVGDVVQNTEQVQTLDLSVTANDASTNTKTEENKDGDAEQLETTNIPNANFLFADEGWRQLWAAIPNRLCSFTAPVLRVEAGRFFWSSETYNKR